MSKTYSIVECFYSPQGEGARVGTMNVFVRFAGCNLQCVDAGKLGRPMRPDENDAGFTCDTDFSKGERYSLEALIALVKETDETRRESLGGKGCGWVILTGGEPTLQVDDELVKALHAEGYRIAIETNGLRPLPLRLDWVSCSPKKGTTPVLLHVNEIRCVVKIGEEPDDQGIHADHYFVSPGFKAPPSEAIAGWKASSVDLDPDTMSWALHFIRFHPRWRLSMQYHKLWGVR